MVRELLGVPATPTPAGIFPAPPGPKPVQPAPIVVEPQRVEPRRAPVATGDLPSGVTIVRPIRLPE
ncbi:MAG TPA: hypothetical protein VJW93_15285 [Candidatus Acidoferrales bacterium]|nr:hypothetical protein [Candidatus Acidoferrales bacterium]